MIVVKSYEEPKENSFDDFFYPRSTSSYINRDLRCQ